MSDISDFADQLQQDVVSDMAESFFGSRKELDNALEAYSGMIRDFLPVVEQLYRAEATLRLLLLDEEEADECFRRLGIDPASMPQAEGAGILSRESLPFALTGKRRFTACVLDAYEQLRKAAQDYLHGQYYDDPVQKGRKRLTMHYRRLEAVADYINEKIRKANEESSVTSVLREVKRLNPVQMEREQIMGDIYLKEGCGLDNDMCFVPIDFKGYQFPDVADLPPMNDVREPLENFCAELYARRREEARQAMKELVGG
ncbi:hypothetical protein [Pseudodesulfovibrio indicus]|uniref:hypothetical protein n=1 Tax=Pseudodesulfovibrio indicus TaxID=1716143 RepID=UPI00292E053D|nr:hypothetical protein [Pseudodesulfovibrio indicus]